ncbi:MAG: ArsR/SmtB family transcription factor [Steroidobacteraceae bacterium]
MSRPRRSGLAKRRAYASVFAALGDPTRLSLVAKLCGGPPRSISKLTEDTRLSRQAVTKHLRVLERARVVHGTRCGRENRFAFNPEPVEDIKKYLDLVSA